MKNFSEREKECEKIFLFNSPFWHLYTSGKETPVFFVEDEDFKFAMNLVFLAKKSVSSVKIIAFTIMDNHMHFVLSCSEVDAKEFFTFLRKKLGSYLYHTGGRELPDGFDLNIKMVEDLKNLRRLIVYTHRNGYVVNPDVTPFSYRWGTGPYYFNIPIKGERVNNLRKDTKRAMFRGRVPEIANTVEAVDGYIVPPSYCETELGAAFFRDGQQYFSMLSKDMESYKELAVEIGDKDYFTDFEIYAKVVQIVRGKCKVDNIKGISSNQKIEIAKTLHYEYRASNEQIRRMLNFTQYEVDALFPLSRKE